MKYLLLVVLVWSAYAQSVTHLSFNSTLTFDLQKRTSNVFSVTLTGDVQILSFVNKPSDGKLIMVWTQDNTGHHKVNFRKFITDACEVNPVPASTTIVNVSISSGVLRTISCTTNPQPKLK